MFDLEKLSLIFRTRIYFKKFQILAHVQNRYVNVILDVMWVVPYIYGSVENPSYIYGSVEKKTSIMTYASSYTQLGAYTSQKLFQSLNYYSIKLE